MIFLGMVLFGIVLMIGGFLIRLFTPLATLGWILMGSGVVIYVIARLTHKK